MLLLPYGNLIAQPLQQMISENLITSRNYFYKQTRFDNSADSKTNIVDFPFANLFDDSFQISIFFLDISKAGESRYGMKVFLLS